MDFVFAWAADLNEQQALFSVNLYFPKLCEVVIYR